MKIAKWIVACFTSLLMAASLAAPCLSASVSADDGCPACDCSQMTCCEPSDHQPAQPAGGVPVQTERVSLTATLAAISANAPLVFEAGVADFSLLSDRMKPPIQDGAPLYIRVCSFLI